MTLEDLGLRAGVSAALGSHGKDDSLLDNVVLRVADDEHNRRQFFNGLGEPQGELDGTKDAAACADAVAHRADHLQLARGSVKHRARRTEGSARARTGNDDGHRGFRPTQWVVLEHLDARGVAQIALPALAALVVDVALVPRNEFGDNLTGESKADLGIGTSLDT